MMKHGETIVDIARRKYAAVKLFLPKDATVHRTMEELERVMKKSVAGVIGKSSGDTAVIP